MTEEQRERRRQMQHARYVRKREEILAYQKQYRTSHKEAIKARRRQRSFERIYLNPNRKPPKTRKEFNRSYYLRHRDEILIKRKIEYDRRKQDTTAI